MIMDTRRELKIGPTTYAPPRYVATAHAMVREDIIGKRRIVCLHIVGHYFNGLHVVESTVALSPSDAIRAAIVLVRSAIAAILNF
jgi:hypothetical protein